MEHFNFRLKRDLARLHHVLLLGEIDWISSEDLVLNAKQDMLYYYYDYYYLYVYIWKCRYCIQASYMLFKVVFFSKKVQEEIVIY